MNQNDITGLTYADFDLLTDKYTDREIAKQYDIGFAKVGYYRRKLKVKSYGEKNGFQVGIKGVSNVTNRKFFFNERFFQFIDSEVKAYTLGLLMADGHITKTMHRARISLTKSDSYILKQICKAMDFEGELIVSKPVKGGYQVHDVYNLNLNSTILCKDLINLGLSTPKNTILSLPKIPHELEHHLIRGLWDGDGAIYRSGSLAGMTGRKPLLEDINRCFQRHGFERGGSIHAQKSVHEMVLGLYAIPILDWIYECNPTIVLKRKLERYQLRKALSKS